MIAGGINHFSWRLAVRLSVWSILSVVIGALVFGILDSPLLRGIALQAIAWGAVDLLIAGFAWVRSVRRSGEPPDEGREVGETVRLRKLLRVNAGLDVVYCLAGAAIALIWWSNRFVLGNGIGVIIQGLFLLVFDLFHARALPAEPPPWYDPAR